MVSPAVGLSLRQAQALLEQPAVISAARKTVPAVFYPAISAKILAEDVFSKKDTPDVKKENLRRDLIVLPITIAGTLLATRMMMHEAPHLLPAVKGLGDHLRQTAAVQLSPDLLHHLETSHKPLSLKQAAHTITQVIRPAGEMIEQLKAAQSPQALQHLHRQLKTQASHLAQVLHNPANHGHEAIDELRQKAGNLLNNTLQDAHATHPGKLRQAVYQLNNLRLKGLFPSETHDHHWDEVFKFVSAGSVTIGSGLLAGLVANKVNGKPAEANQNVVKEGVFQMVANVLFCGLGVSAGEAAVNALKLQQTRWPRMAVVATGLAGGIASGALLANKMGTAIVTKLYPQQAGAAAAKPDRKIEGWDMGVHLDDVPLLFKFGMDLSVMEAAIPPFFWFSGFRTGRGYRNQDPNAQNTPATPGITRQDAQALAKKTPPAFMLTVGPYLHDHMNPFGSIRVAADRLKSEFPVTTESTLQTTSYLKP